MEPKIGCKSSGLGTDILFEDGIPRVETMDTLLSSIDEQLGDTNRQIEACVKSILEMSNSMLVAEVPKYYHPGEAVKTIRDKHMLEKTACYDTEPDEITKLLRCIMESLDSSPGCEENVLEQILQLSSQEGFSLPLQSTGAGPIDHSVMSINTAVNDSESLNETLWNEICMRLQKYFIQKIKKLGSTTVISMIDLTGVKRLQYVQSLCSLYSAKAIWGRYRNVRSQQYGEELLTYGMSSLSSSENIAFEKGIQHFEKLVLITQTMIQDDFDLLNSGIFGSVISTMDAIEEIYLDKILDDIGIIVDSLQSELLHVTVKISTKKTKDTDSKPFPKSTSEAGSLNQFRGNLRKQQSKSLDSLLSREDNFTDLQTLPGDIIGLLIRFVNCVLNIDSYVQQLHSLLTWEMGHMSNKKKQPKRLKSALKSRREMGKVQSMNRPLFIPSDSDLETSGTFTGSPLPAVVPNQAMMAQMTSSLRVVPKQSTEKKLWDWKGIFHKVSADVAKCVEQKIATVSDKIIEYDAGILEKSNKFEMVSVHENLVGGRLDYPAKVSKGTAELFQELDLLLVLANAFSEGPLQIIQTAFIDSVAITLKNLHVKYIQISKEVPISYQEEVWYQCLSNCAYIRNHLLIFESVLSSDDHCNSKKTLSSLYKKYCELNDVISNRIIDYQNTLLSTSILQDAESHNWEDTKDFFEDERCSFAIHMWNLHMKALQNDMWVCCPPIAAQTIYGAVLKETLWLFEQRYSAVKPSYRRTKQIKFDITAILLCTVELLMPACTHTGMYLDPNSNQKMVYSIHNSCCTLLSVLAMISSPLDTLYKAFKKGFKKRHSRSSEAQMKMYMSHWLSWVYPSVFPSGKDCLDDFQTTTALYLQLKILCSQPDIKWGLFLESLVMKDYTLPIMILTQTAKLVDTGNKSQDDSKLTLESSKDETEVLEIFTSFTNVLVQLDGFPEALSKTLLPVLERTDSWELFDNDTTLGRSHLIPPWIKVILSCLQKFIRRALEAGLRVLLLKAELDERKDDDITSAIQDLPCGCPFTNLKSVETPRKKNKEVMAEAMYSIITQVNDDVYMLPTPLIIFLKAVQEQVNQKGLHSPHDCVAIKLLATCLRCTLIDTELIENWLGMTVSEDMKDNLRMLAECTYHVLTATSCGKSSGIPRIASQFMKANRNWLSEQIELLSDHFSHGLFEMPEFPGSLHGATEDYVEQVMVSVLSHIQNTSNGLQHLRNCFNLVENNFHWIIEQLDIPPLLGSPGTPKKLVFKFSKCRNEKEPFNPIKEYQKVGDVNFDQALVGSFEYNWTNLLLSDLGLSEVGMKTLLYHRHEMQDGAFLEENEKKPVEGLRKKFDCENSDLL